VLFLAAVAARRPDLYGWLVAPLTVAFAIVFGDRHVLTAAGIESRWFHLRKPPLRWSDVRGLSLNRYQVCLLLEGGRRHAMGRKLDGMRSFARVAAERLAPEVARHPQTRAVLAALS